MVFSYQTIRVLEDRSIDGTRRLQPGFRRVEAKVIHAAAGDYHRDGDVVILDEMIRYTEQELEEQARKAKLRAAARRKKK
jgi:hypothetical protein